MGAGFLSLLLPGVFNIMDTTFSGRKLRTSSLLVVIPASYVFGVMFMSWGSYLLACALNKTGNPLRNADMIMMTAAIVFLAVVVFFKRAKLANELKHSLGLFDYAEMIVVFIAVCVSYILMFNSFYHKEDYTGVGVSVFSDFSTHIGMIRSFSSGNNFPAVYSHYAGADMKYHFMHQFFVGNLEFLGLRLDLAFNIPSIITFVGTCMLIFALSLKLFGKRMIGVTAVLFFIFRSSRSFLEYMAGIDGTFKEIIKKASENTDFIGSTTNENWGLYNLNVYANQRHLAFGLCVILLALIFMLPPFFAQFVRIRSVLRELEQKKILRAAALSCEAPAEETIVNSQNKNTSTSVSEESEENESGKTEEKLPNRFILFFRESFFSADAWLPVDIKTAVVTGLMLGMCSFFNGACVIGCLLVLLFIAAASDRRLEFALTAIIAVILSVIQSNTFIDGKALSFRWEPGYLADVKSLFGTIEFINTLLGIFVVLLIASAVILNGYYRWLLVAFTTPIVFALTFQMTNDTSVNHKYIMIGCMLADIFIAAFIRHVFVKKGVFVKVVALGLIAAMTVTGIYEFTIFIRKNSEKNNGIMKFYDNDALTDWVMDNSDAKDVYLTNWYSLNNLVFGGGMLYYGWPYYAWSAGYDTAYREAKAIEMYTAYDSETLKELAEEEGIRFIVVDFSERDDVGNPAVYGGYTVNVINISNTYECVFSDGTKFIYDTEKEK